MLSDDDYMVWKKPDVITTAFEVECKFGIVAFAWLQDAGK